MDKKYFTLKILLMGVLFFAISSYLTAQQTISGRFSSNGNTRTYLGAVPDNPEPPMRLVILFCGIGEGAEQMAQRHFNDYLGNNTMVVYPEPWFWLSSFGYEIGSEQNDFLMVEDLIHHIDSNYAINLNDICIGGVSQGGVFTYDLVCEYNRTESTRPYRFKAFAVVAGGMDSSYVNLDHCNIAKEVPLIAIHGTADAGIFYEGNTYYDNGQDTAWYNNAHTEDVVHFWAKTINGCDETPSVTPLPDLVIEPQEPSTVELIEYNCDNCSNTQLYKIYNGFHTWPTSDAWIDNLYGGHNQDIIASQLIAEFFECTSSVVSTAVVNVAPGRVSVYPNPVSDLLSIETRYALEKIEIYNITGRQVYANLQPGFQVSTADMSPGIYFLKIETAAGTDVKKIIKE